MGVIGYPTVGGPRNPPAGGDMQTVPALGDIYAT